MKYRLLILLTVCLIIPQTIGAQAFSETRTFKRGFRAGKDLSFEIVSKYGTIEISNGKSDSVLIRAEVTATSSNSQRMRKMLNGVSVNMIETSYSIRVQSDFSSNPGFLFEDIKSITGKLIPYENRLQINYFIILPEGINIKIDNMYGDVYLEDVSAELSLKLSNGSLQTGAINRASLIELSFVNGSLAGISSGNINISYSDLKIGGSDNLTITAKSSKVELASVMSLNINSRRDKIFIGEAGSLTADAYFSDFSVESVSDEAMLKSTYGSFRTPSLLKSLTMLSVTSQFTDLYFGLEPGFQAGVDIKSTSTRTSLPAEGASLTTQVLNSEKNETVSYGYIGREKSGTRVKIDAVRGSLTIKNQ
jgi:hypothetical protein